MPIVQILMTLVVIGVIIWLIQTYIPMPAPIKTVITVILILFLCIILLAMTGLTNLRLEYR